MIDGWKAKKNGTGSMRAMLLGEARTMDEMSAVSISKSTKHRILNG